MNKRQRKMVEKLALIGASAFTSAVINADYLQRMQAGADKAHTRSRRRNLSAHARRKAEQDLENYTDAICAWGNQHPSVKLLGPRNEVIAALFFSYLPSACWGHKELIRRKYGVAGRLQRLWWRLRRFVRSLFDIPGKGAGSNGGGA